MEFLPVVFQIPPFPDLATPSCSEITVALNSIRMRNSSQPVSFAALTCLIMKWFISVPSCLFLEESLFKSSIVRVQ